MERARNKSFTPIGSVLVMAGLSLSMCALVQSAPAGQESAHIEPADGHDALIHLREAWRMDPLNEVTAHQLALWRQRLEQERTVALTQLVHGLKEFLAGRAHIAARSIGRARQSPQVEMMADASLPVSLATLEQQAHAAAKAAGIDALCPQCGDSGFKDCPNQYCWRSFGYLPCKTCDGSGRERKDIATPKAELSICSTCQGFSLTDCPVCAGKGLVVCDVCHLPLQNELTPEEVAAIRRVIAIATHRVFGGPQLYSAEALAPSPRFVEPGGDLKDEPDSELAEESVATDWSTRNL